MAQTGQNCCRIPGAPRALQRGDALHRNAADRSRDQPTPSETATPENSPSSVGWSEQSELQLQFHIIGGRFGMICPLHTIVGVATPTYRAEASRRSWARSTRWQWRTLR